MKHPWAMHRITTEELSQLKQIEAYLGNDGEVFGADRQHTTEELAAIIANITARTSRHNALAEAAQRG